MPVVRKKKTVVKNKNVNNNVNNINIKIGSKKRSQKPRKSNPKPQGVPHIINVSVQNPSVPNSSSVLTPSYRFAREPVPEFPDRSGVAGPALVPPPPIGIHPVYDPTASTTPPSGIFDSPTRPPSPRHPTVDSSSSGLFIPPITVDSTPSGLFTSPITVKKEKEPTGSFTRPRVLSPISEEHKEDLLMSPKPPPVRAPRRSDTPPAYAVRPVIRNFLNNYTGRTIENNSSNRRSYLAQRNKRGESGPLPWEE